MRFDGDEDDITGMKIQGHPLCGGRPYKFDSKKR